MKNEIYLDGNISYDLNGLEVNSVGSSMYKGVFYEKDRGEYSVSVTNTDKKLRPDTRGIIISTGFADSRDAAYTYKVFTQNLKENFIKFDKAGSRNWTINKTMPKWEYDSLDENIDFLQRKKMEKIINVDYIEAYIKSDDDIRYIDYLKNKTSEGRKLFSPLLIGKYKMNVSDFPKDYFKNNYSTHIMKTGNVYELLVEYDNIIKNSLIHKII